MGVIHLLCRASDASRIIYNEDSALRRQMFSMKRKEENDKNLKQPEICKQRFKQRVAHKNHSFPNCRLVGK